MKRATDTAITLVCVLLCEHQRVFGTEVDVRVKPGENITLYCDRVVPLGSHIIWMRNCSHENQPSLFIDPSKMFQWMFPRFSLVPNSSSNSVDLHMENVSVSDEGLYYCAITARDVTRNTGLIFEHQYGNTQTRLSVLVSTHGEASTPPHFLCQDCRLCFQLLLAVSLLCVLLLSICVYFLWPKKTTVSAATQTENRHCKSEAGVCYASLNKTSKLKSKKPQSSDFSVYTEIRIPKK